jgi:hypothetical protein
MNAKYCRTPLSSPSRAIFILMLSAICARSQVFDLWTDFSPDTNPNPPWTYGWENSPGGVFTPYLGNRMVYTPDGLPENRWRDVNGDSGIFENASAQTENGTCPPGACWMTPGKAQSVADPNPPKDLYAAIRFSPPISTPSVFNVSVSASPYDGNGGATFLLLSNGVAIISQKLAGNQSFSLSNSMVFQPGDTIDILLGPQLLPTGFYEYATMIVAATFEFVASTDAPSFASQPQSRAVPPGGTANLAVTVNGGAPLVYQWYSGDSGDTTRPVPGATNAAFTTPPLFASGSYWVEAQNSFGSANSASALVVVLGPGVYDLAANFSATNNPNSPWFYGWEPNLGGPFIAYVSRKVLFSDDNGAQNVWQDYYGSSGLFENPTGNFEVGNAGQTSFAPGAVWWTPGVPGLADNFAAIRFSPPSGEGGVYTVSVGMTPQTPNDPDLQGDCVFYAQKNGATLFTQYLPAEQSLTWGQTIALQPGDNFDLILGRGDNSTSYGDVLFLSETLSLTAATNGPASTNPPAIYIQPQSQFVSAGNSITLSVAATGGLPLFYQWYAGAGGDISNPVAGATNATMTTAPLSTNASFWVAIQNGNGVLPSATAVITVLGAGAYDLAADFSATNNPNPPWVYGWETTVGGTFVAYSASKVDYSDNNYPQNVWQDYYGSSGIFENPTDQIEWDIYWTSKVIPGAVWWTPGAPGLPDNLAAIRFTPPAGEGGVYEVNINMTPQTLAPALQGDTVFYLARNGVQIFAASVPAYQSLAMTNQVPLQPGDNLDLLLGRGEDDTSYGDVLFISARLNLAAGANNAFSTNPPAIYTQPQSQRVEAGSSATFSVSASGAFPLTYQWYAGASGDTSKPVSGATNFAFTIPGVAASGEYWVLVVDAYGAVNSSTASLTRLGEGVYDLWAGFSATNNPSSPWTFGWETVAGGPFVPYTRRKVTYSDNYLPQHVWQDYYGSSGLFENPTTSLETGNGGQSLFPPGAVWWTPGDPGFADNFAAIRFSPPPGEGGLYSASASLSPQTPYDPGLQGDTVFHLFLNGAEILTNYVPAEQSLAVTNQVALQPGDNLDLVLGRGDDSTSFGDVLFVSATLVLETPADGPPSTNPPTIYTQPQSQRVVAGQSASLSVNAGGGLPLAYQWYAGTNGDTSRPVAGATSPVFVTPPLSASDSYWVSVQNASGLAESVSASVTVVGPGDFDLGADYSATNNPNAPWTYGWEVIVGGPFVAYAGRKVDYSDDGFPINVWQDYYGSSALFENPNNQTATGNGGDSLYQPGAVWWTPGLPGLVDNLAAIRFSPPDGQGGVYSLSASVTPQSPTNLDIQGNTIFYVLTNGTQMLSNFVASGQSSGLTNQITLHSGDALDFLLGRGDPGNSVGDVMFITAALDLVSPDHAPPSTNSRPNVRVALQPLGATVAYGMLQLGFKGAPGVSYVLESTSVLGPSALWQPVFTNTANTSGAWSFAATNGQPARFYRLKRP